MPIDGQNKAFRVPSVLFAGKRDTQPMARLYSAEEWIERFHKPPRKPKRTVVTIGNFDGVHLGHQAILRATVEGALAYDAMSVALTFFPHPLRILNPTNAPPLLMTLDQRLAAIEECGVAAALVLTFDDVLARLSARDFVQKILRETLRTYGVVYGENFRFGYQRAGDAHLLYDMGIELYPSDPVTVDGMVVSSTAIREALREGRVEDARKLLGRPYALAGEICPGTGMGSKLVVPTLNLATKQELLPKLGVYATEVILERTCYRAATNVGVRPTFDGGSVSVESHLLDFNETRTSSPLEIRFLKRLRDEQRFSGAEALREQILRDIQSTREYFQSQPANT
jgi:riboflavin kinase / FMN adenylyltransferase